MAAGDNRMFKPSVVVNDKEIEFLLDKYVCRDNADLFVMISPDIVLRFLMSYRYTSKFETC